MATSLKDIIDRGDLNSLAAVLKAALVGSILNAGGVRLHAETVAVASAAATPSYTVKQLLFAKTIGTGAPAVKAAGINGATPGTGAAAPNTAGTSIVFNAETTGTGTVDLIYLTADPPKDADGIAATALSGSITGIY